MGTTIGAGIYVLIGEVAGSAGPYMPISFILASLLAACTVFSFAELSARFPVSAGEAVYLYEAFARRWLSVAVGLYVAFAGIVSSATISRGFVGYLHAFVAAPDWLAIALLVGSLGAVAALGITQSVLLAVAITMIETGGLLFVIWTGWDRLLTLPAHLPELLPPFQADVWNGILAGTILAFYAFLGFEDMVNVAEEVKDVRRNLPRAIIVTLVATTGLYIALALIATLSLPVDDLAASKAPLALLVQRDGGFGVTAIGLIAIVAILNGALIQVVMAARVLYGLANRGWLPRALAAVNPTTQTPLLATVLVTGTILAFALWLPLVVLAEITSFLALIVFAAVNLALWRIKRRDPAPDTLIVPAWVPVAGFASSAGILIWRIANLALAVLN